MYLLNAKSILSVLTRTKKRLEKPIFLVGCAKSGTTMLGQIFFSHPDVGPKNLCINYSDSLQGTLNGLTDLTLHGKYAIKMEEKALWDKYFPINNIYLRMGKEMIIFSNPLNSIKTKKLKNDIAANFSEKRFFSKQPFNTFRIHVLREIFPDAKIIAIHRDGRDVISSWGRENNRWESFKCYKDGIKVFGQKWNEAVDHIENFKKDLDIYTFKYEDLLTNPSKELKLLFDFCGLYYFSDIFGELNFPQNIGKWRERIPPQFHSYLIAQTEKNLKMLGYE